MFLHYVQVKQVKSQRANMSPHTAAYVTAKRHDRGKHLIDAWYCGGCNKR